MNKFLSKDTMKIYILFFFFASLIFTQNLKENDTLIINPITWATPSPIGCDKQYRTAVDLPIVRYNWHRIFIIQTFKIDSSTKANKYLCGKCNCGP